MEKDFIPGLWYAIAVIQNAPSMSARQLTAYDSVVSILTKEINRINSIN